MTSFLDSLELDDSNHRLASRKSVISAKTRVDNQYGTWFRQADTQASLAERIDYAYEELRGLVVAACDEHGTDDYDSVLESIVASYAIESPQRTASSDEDDEHHDHDPEKECASCGKELSGSDYGLCSKCEKQSFGSVHESRKPKMCPFHKDVVDISLTSEDPRAGYDAMAQHWGGPRHCEGSEYEGSKCNFKPQMTTQSWWDEKATKAEERKQQRAEQNEQAQQETVPSSEIDDDFAHEETKGLTEAVPAETIAPVEDSAEVINFPSEPAGDTAEAVEVPMSMAAKTADKDVTGLGTTENPINKDKWTPKNVPFLEVDDKDGRWPTHRIDVIEPIKPSNGGDRFNPSKLEQIGEQVTEHVELDSNIENAGFNDGGETSGGPTKTFPKGPQADPVTSAAFPPGYGDKEQYNGPIGRAVYQLVSVGYSPEEARRIVEEHPLGGSVPVPGQADLNSPADPALANPVGETNAQYSSIPHDVDKNPITAIALGDYDGFLPANVVQQAIAKVQ